MREMLETTLVHEFHIFYSPTEWILLSSFCENGKKICLRSASKLISKVNDQEQVLFTPLLTLHTPVNTVHVHSTCARLCWRGPALKTTWKTLRRKQRPLSLKPSLQTPGHWLKHCSRSVKVMQASAGSVQCIVTSADECKEILPPCR